MPLSAPIDQTFLRCCIDRLNPQSTPATRRSCLQAIARGLEARSDELVELISREMGMPAHQVYDNQIESAIETFHQYAELVEAYDWDRRFGNARIVKEPVGVCGFITPWNFPMLQVAGKVAPAVAAGCTLVLKPSELAPLDAMVLAEVVEASELPPGVFNLVNGYGPEVGAAIASHPDVDMVSFTGSTRAGVSVAKAAADSVKRVTQELGGKSPNVILDDADMHSAVAGGVENCLLNSGQCCDSPTRMLVPRERHDEAVTIAREAMEQIVVGDPIAADSDLGPLVSASQFDKVQSLIQAGLDEGAELMIGGSGRPAGLTAGYYAKPTLFANVSNDMTIAQEEIFGPVLCVIPYDDEDDAIRIANDTPYGLAAYVSSGDSARASRIASRLRAGQVHINDGEYQAGAPFGGYKMSGNGREFGEWGLAEYLETKAVFGDQ